MHTACSVYFVISAAVNAKRNNNKVCDLESSSCVHIDFKCPSSLQMLEGHTGGVMNNILNPWALCVSVPLKNPVGAYTLI